METIEKIRIAVPVNDMRELLNGTSLCAGKGKNTPPILNSIALSVTGNKLMARATDRYRLIEGTLTLESESELPVTLISLADSKRVLDLMKGISVGYVIIERDESERLTVSVNGNSALTISPVDGNFPTVESTDRLLTEPEKLEPVESIAFDAKLFADFGKISKRVTLKFTGDRKLINIGLDGNQVTWRAALMPMRQA